MSQSHPTAVIITAKNAADTIAYAVRSALAQSCVAEVIVVDDGSSDATGSTALACDDGSGRVKVIRFEMNRGPSAGRNAAIEASTAPFLCVLDADDFMDADRLEKMFARGGEAWDLLADDMNITTSYSAEAPSDLMMSDYMSLPCDLDLELFGVGNLPQKTGHRRELGFLKPIIRRAFLDQHAIRYDERLRLGEDLIFYATCMINGARFRLVPACGYYAVRHDTSLSAVHETRVIAALHGAVAEFIATAERDGRPVGTLRDYLRYSRDNLAFRRVLEAKRQGGLVGLTRSLSENLSSTPFIVRQVARAKLGRLARRQHA